jgi:hypothetical protein
LSSPKSILPEALSEVLGVSVSEVLRLYYSESDDVKRNHLIRDALDYKRTAEEGEEWLREEVQKRDVVTELIHRRREDDLF